MACPLEALADIAPDPEYGQSLAPSTPTDIVIMREEVVVTLGREEAGVQAIFYLYNTGETQELEVGFPDVARYARYSSDTGSTGLSEYKLRDFRALVDGQAVEHTYRHVRGDETPVGHAAIEAAIRDLEAQHRETESGASRLQLRRQIQSEHNRRTRWNYLGWLVWPMQFMAQERREVEVTYRVPYQGTYSPTLLRERHISYVLRTGAAWKGNIRHAQITLAFDEGVTPAHIQEVKPSNYVLQDGCFVWDLKNFEPTEDIEVTLVRYLDAADAVRGFLAEYEEELKASSDPRKASYLLGWAAEAQEEAGLYEDCIATCRRLIAEDREWLKLDFRGKYDSWRLRIVRCHEALGDNIQARKAALEAIEAIEPLLASEKLPELRDFDIVHLREQLAGLREKYDL